MQDSYQVQSVARASVDDRAAFITRTYQHLFGAILVFIGLEVALFKTGVAYQITDLLLASRFGWLAALGGFMIVGTLGSSMARKAGSVGKQYTGLGIYIVGEAIIMAPLLVMAHLYSGADIIGNAALVTAIGFSGLTAIAITSRRDLSGMGPYLKWGSFCAIGLIVASIFLGFNLGIIFSGAMIVLAGGYILYQTSNIMRHYPTTHHVSAALELFASVALMFWYVLQLLMSLNRD
ncbi:MAG: Bax inhibitor-1 family protein [Planctomycetota bacterium]|nr:Bax inhibitor-1 family protein [Planctomycetota bacterium]